MPKQSGTDRKATRAATRKRANASCDLCKGRKTKCIDPEPGPCRYCVSVGAPCTFTIKRKQRPFYLVSEEEYQYGIQILQRLFPDQELNLETLRRLALNIDAADNSGKHTPPSNVQSNVRSQVCEDDEPSEEAPPAEEPGISNGSLSTVRAALDANNNRVESSFAQLPTQRKGSLITDSMGTSRYLGPQSDAIFISAVRSCAEGKTLNTPAGHMGPAMGFAQLPPILPRNRSSMQDTHLQAYLPARRQDWTKHVDRYFKEVNSTYWLISSEGLCSRLDSMYTARDKGSGSASWMCFLYTVLALTSQANDSDMEEPSGSADKTGFLTPQSGPASGPSSSETYLSMAKALLYAVLEEANLDSVRALSSLSIFMYNQGFGVLSYLNIGMAVKIAYTLGLHRPQSYNEMETLHRENAIRISWTLYQLDCDISRPPGRPCNISETIWHSITPSEMAMSSGIYDPWGLVKFSASFSLEDRRIFRMLSNLSKSSDQETIRRETHNCVTLLQRWYEGVPAHLYWDAPVAPPHRRPICLLHLRYWSTIIFSTRLALLTEVQSMQRPPADQQPKLSTLSQACVDACEQSLKILELMQSSASLSSLTSLDTKYIVEAAMIFLLVLSHGQNSKLQRHLDRCLELLQSMDRVGLCKFAGGDLLMLIESYKARFCSGRRMAKMPLEQRIPLEEVYAQTQPEDCGMDFLWNQEFSIANLDWNFFSWEAYPGPQSQPWSNDGLG